MNFQSFWQAVKCILLHHVFMYFQLLKLIIANPNEGSVYTWTPIIAFLQLP